MVDESIPASGLAHPTPREDMSVAPTVVKTTCCYCGVGCGIEVEQRLDGTLDLRGDPDHPGSQGQLCSKGRTLLHTVAAREERLLWPQMRTQRDAPLRRTGWDEAIAHVAARFRAIIAEHGPDAVAFYVSGQCTTEEYYLANKLMKGFIGSNNIDTNSRLCMSSAVVGYKKTLGADSVPVCYDDLDSCDTFLIAGANPAWAHPIIFRRIEARKNADPNRVRLICVDPRRTATAAASDLHLPIRPGTDVALFHGIAAELLRNDAIDHAFIAEHTNDWEALAGELAQWPVQRAADICGVPAADIATAAQWLSGDRRFLSLWTMGLNQSAVGVDKNTSLINLSLLTGKIGKPGCGPFSLTGQPNAMGGREVGGLANLLPAHRDLANPDHRAEVAKFWGVREIRAEPGLTAVEQFAAAKDGRLKALWVICTNPAASLPDRHTVEAGLRQLELLVVQDIFPTDTTRFADVLLPAATWLEKSGTMTTSERRIALVERLVNPPGEALPDITILQRFATALGHGKDFAYADSAAIFAEHAALTAGRDCDISGLDHARLRQERSLQWPVPNRDSLGTPRLYTDHIFATANGRANFCAPTFLERSEMPDADYPLILDTGRLRDQWHTMSKTGRVRRLRDHAPIPQVQIHPDDAELRGIRSGDLVNLHGHRGHLRVAADVTTDIRPGVVFFPMHFSVREGGELAACNTLTSSRFDPISKEPDLKHAAVQAILHRPAARQIVIVGGGAAALGLAEAWLAAADNGRILRDTLTIIGEEPEGIYNRVLLPHYVDGSKPWSELMRGTSAELAERGVRLVGGRRIERIDRQAKTVIDAQGQVIPYDTLILATGSRANRPTTGPLARPGTFSLRNRGDAEGIRAEALRLGRNRPARIVIQGAGLLGLELADALNHLGADVTILQRTRRLMGRIVDATASALLASHLTERGITIAYDANLLGFGGRDRVESVRLDDGREFPCDAVVFATGTLANMDLARSSGLACGGGITVDASLCTTDPDIYAIGECAEHAGKRVGTTAGSEAMARTLIAGLRGDPQARWQGCTEASILKVRGVAVTACGVVDEEGQPGCETIVHHDPRERIYRKAVVKDGRLIGVCFIGEVDGFAEHRDLIASGHELDDLRRRLLRLGGSGGGAKGKVICACNQVGDEDIRACIAQGASTIEAVCTASRAGTSCGSCRGEVRKILEHAAVSVS